MFFRFLKWRRVGRRVRKEAFSSREVRSRRPLWGGVRRLGRG